MREHLESRGRKVLVICFADLLEFYTKQYWGWDGQKDECGYALLKKIEDQMRAHYPNYWGEMVGKFIDVIALNDEFDYCLIADWKFHNELQAVRRYIHSGKSELHLLRIKRLMDNGKEYLNPLMTFEQLNDASECELDGAAFEWIIYNQGNTEELEENVKLYLQFIDKTLNL